MQQNKSIAIPQQKWVQIAGMLELVAKIHAIRLKEVNHEGKGQQDHDEFLADMQLAHAAVMYVANFATDKVRAISERSVPNV